MPKISPLTLLKLWGALTVIVITTAIVNYLSDQFNFMDSIHCRSDDHRFCLRMDMLPR